MNNNNRTNHPHGIDRGLTNYGDKDFARYLRRSFARSMGYTDAMLDRPVVGVAYTASGFNNCHRHFPEMLEAVKRGVLAAGALPIPFPTISLGEVFLSPTSLKFRNLMALDTEEMIRAQPMDAVVLMGGCDKTLPAQLMAAASADLPAVALAAGPMSTSRHRGERLGACTDCRRFWANYRAGKIDDKEINEVEGKLATTAGTCAVMGTASTMACIAEALGMVPLGHGSIPAVHADRLRAAEDAGAVAVNHAHPGQAGEEGAVQILLQLLRCLVHRAAYQVDLHPHIVGVGAGHGDVNSLLAACRSQRIVAFTLRRSHSHYLGNVIALHTHFDGAERHFKNVLLYLALHHGDLAH